MTGAVSIAEAPTTGIGRLVADNRFFVPTHQRDYRWDRDRVEKFVEDLVGALDRADRLYFVGLMVFMRDEDGRLRVLDGQQRLATAVIIFSALRAWFAVNESGSDTHGQLQYDFIGRMEYGDTSPTPKLSLNLNNNDLFQKFVVQGSPLHLTQELLRKTGKNDSNYSLLDAVVYIHEQISEIAVKQSHGAAAYFASLIKFLRDSVIVVRLTVPNESNAFKVFETLNDRGIDLSAIDLVKNYLFGLAHQESAASLRQMEHRWGQFSETLKQSKQDDFLKTYWISRHGLSYTDDIFDGVKAVCKDSIQAQNMSQDMLEAAEYFAALDSCEDVMWRPFSDRCRELTDDLRVIGSKLVRPVILAAVKRFTPNEFERLLWLLQVVIVRWQIVKGGRPGIIERTCARLAQSIWKSETTTSKASAAYLAEPYTTDEIFRQDFQKYYNSAGSKTSYLLRKIEERQRSSLRGLAGRDLKPSKMTLEHIFPKNPSVEWQVVIDDDPTILPECGELIGNLCLVSEARNKELGRQGFEKKKLLFATSDIETTKEIDIQIQWTRAEILARQSLLAGRAVQIWRVT